jgi:2-oxo-4-hydroxy-4-carboxy-5-ureidoimidazoline decarboxylase
MGLYSLAAVNEWSEEAFVEAFGDLFEDTPAIAHHLAQQRPFTSVAAFQDAIASRLTSLTSVERTAFLCAHPDLGSKARMADASVQEQAGAGLDRLTEAEFARFQQLNQAYRERFEIPFIVAVRNHTKASILAAFEERLHHLIEAEHDHALAEVLLIIGFRLGDRLQADA